jgi:hypothetical protein
LAAILLFAVVASVASADDTITIWQWTDAQGVTRYTPDFGRIPGSARHSAVAMQPGASPPPTDPVYFEPNPRAPVVGIPDQTPQSATGSAAPSTPVIESTRPSDLAGRIRELEAQIAADEEALKQLISAPGIDADVEVSPELREIAARLPQLQAQLAALEQRRGGSSSP